MKELHKELVPILDELLENVIEKKEISEQDYVTSQFVKILNGLSIKDIEFRDLLKIIEEWDVARVGFLQGQDSYIEATIQTEIFIKKGGFRPLFYYKLF